MNMIAGCKMTRVLFGIWLTVAASAGWALDFSGKDLKGLPCTGNAQGYGPFDYTNQTHVRVKLPIVEQFHFTREVEALKRGRSGPVATDLDYTLRAFPNHHRALFAVIRLATDKKKRDQSEVGEMSTPPECYLKRALVFRPNDGAVHMLFGLYLHRLDKLDEAETHYRKAVELMPRSAEAHYNLGLLLVDQKRYEDAVPEAQLAYKLGYPLSGLRKRLASAGHAINQ